MTCISFKPCLIRLCCALAAGGLLALPTAAQTATDSSPDDWNVGTPPSIATPRTIPLDVTSGTWMSLDVSPDGRTLLFDLLGDIYKMPISGGQAIALTEGLAWDMQPRYSPDGTEIAFTSDRAGGENIWIMDSAGSTMRAVTRETFRLLNNPAWSPDGRFIAARKHFTTERSLGTGEIWLYHKEGGKGVRLVERPGPAFQKEQGEPAFSPDGQFLYYSRNITPGNRFIYAQDSNTELFQIKRLDLESGTTTTAAGGPGGAVRPTPSPGGRYLAYVKRVRAKSRLFIKDLRSGIETMIDDDLDQDNQETWAVQGLYPGMDWLPDDSAVMYWARGKIWRTTPDGKKTEIPFRVTHNRTVYPAVRRTVPVDSDQFSTKMARFAALSPDGTRTVFEALGKLYIKTGDGPAERLTRDSSQTFELFPVWAPDGRTVYFATWDDEELGSIRRVSATPGSRAAVLTREPGHYVELAIIPDGSALLFRKAQGGGLLSPDWSERPGLYSLATQGGAIRFISPRGTDPHAGPQGRVFALERADGALQLISMTATGHDIRIHTRGTLASAMRAAPDGRSVVFVENYQLHWTPLPPASAALDISAGSQALPVRQVSTLGATYFGFTPSGSRLYWSLGPTLKAVRTENLAAADFEPPENGETLSVTAPVARPTGSVALIGARVITMEDTVPLIEDAVVLIEGNKIAAIGPRGDVAIPPRAREIDASGKTIIPGLIDIHAHGPQAKGHVIPQQNWSLGGHLALGVTTIHDPSVRSHQFFPAAEYARAGVILAPRMFATGEIVYGAKAPGFYAEINSLDDALTHVRRLKAQGAFSVKNYNQPRREQRQMVVEAARREGMFVVAEGGALYHMDMTLIVDGNTGVEHTLPNAQIYDDVLSLWPATGVGLSSTLVVGFGGLTGEHRGYRDTEVWKHPVLARHVPPPLLRARSVRRITAPEADFQDDDNAALAKALMDRGVTVNIGGHGQREGLAAHWEMQSFVRGGMTEMQALRTATLNPARYFGIDRELGSLAPGKLADLVILEANPLDDIRGAEQIWRVMLNGRLYDPLTLNEVETGKGERRPYYWQNKPESAIQ